jgi:homocysteine S-methyltransferase
VGALLRSAHAAVGDVPLVVYPNHGASWDEQHKCWIGPTGGSELPSLAPEWLEAGARLIGGCCGVGSDGIRALAVWRDSMSTSL